VFSPAASGLYRAGNRLVTALADMFVQPAGLLVTTGLAAACAGRHAAAWARERAGSGGRVRGAVLARAGGVVVATVAPVLLGPAWAGAGPIIAFCLARMAALPIAVAGAVLVIENRQDRVLWIQSVAALVTVGLTLALAHRGLWRRRWRRHAWPWAGPGRWAGRRGRRAGAMTGCWGAARWAISCA
jgi:O-antigen/teichoic acid export membrane protein